MALTALLLMVLSACGGELETPAQVNNAAAAEPARNVVLICIDTVGADNFFSERIEDRLLPWMPSAQQYRDASSAAPWTIPSVASTLTGLYPVQHHAGAFEKPVANLDVDLPGAVPEAADTLAERLAANGFTTGAFSAHPWFEADFGFDQGFEQLHLRKGWQNVTGRFWQWLDSRPAEQPFFGYLHFMEAHDWHAKSDSVLQERLAGLEPGVLNELRADSSTEACADQKAEICLRNMVYNLAVRELRTAIASVLAGLQDRGRLSETLVVVFSDHGEEFWQHKAEHEQRGDPRGFFGYGHGHSLYQEMLNVPLLGWHPHAAGSVHDAPVSLIDVLPSILDWLGIGRSGQDLPGQPLPLGPDAAPAGPRTLFASGIAYGAEAVASREGDAKSILYLQQQNFEHFDLARDPREKRPLHDDGRTMRADVLTGDYLDLATAAIAYRPDLGEEQLEKLKSIGYLQGVDEAGGEENDDRDDPDQDEEP